MFGQKVKDFLNNLGQKPPAQPAPPAQEPPPQHPFDPTRKILNLSNHLGFEDWVTLGQLYSGVHIFGGNGSGKTSGSGAYLAFSLMKLGAGFVWLCAKPDEVFLVRKLARAAGRESQLRIVGQAIHDTRDEELWDEQGKPIITAERFNALDYENRRQGGSLSVVKYLAECYRAIQRSQTEGGGGNSAFWQTQYERLGRYLVDTAKFSGLKLTVGVLRKLQLSAPRSVDQLADEEWKKNSLLIAALQKAEKRIYEAPEGSEERQRRQSNFDSIKNFWLSDWLTLDEKPKSTLDVMFAALADAFTVEPTDTILTQPTTVTPEDVMNGAIVVLNLPTRRYFEPGIMAQFAFKYSFQRSVLGRSAASIDTRPVVLWADEAHNFISNFDREYQAEVRSFKAITVYLEQSVEGYMAALGAKSTAEVDAFLANLQLRFFHQNSSPKTNEYAASVIGRDWMEVENLDGGGGVNFSNQLHFQVEPVEFTRLRRGGPANQGIVEAYVYSGGIPFKATGKSFMKTQFQQLGFTR